MPRATAPRRRRRTSSPPTTTTAGCCWCSLPKMTSRNRNFAILGIVLALLGLAGPCRPAARSRSPRKLGLDLKGGIELVYQGRPRRRCRRSRRRRWTTRSTRSASAPTRSASPSPRSSARARPDLGRPPGRAERRARDRAGGHHRAAPVLRLGAERARPRRPDSPYAGSKALFQATEAASKQKPKAEATRRAAGLRPVAARRPTRANDTTSGPRYYLFGPDEIPIGPDKKPLRTGRLRPGQHLQGGALGLRRRRRARRRSTPRAPPACEELEALGSGGPARGLAGDRGAQGHHGRRGRAASRTSPPRSSASSCSRTTPS